MLGNVRDPVYFTLFVEVLGPLEDGMQMILLKWSLISDIKVPVLRMGLKFCNGCDQ
jgi:hypothetical protein